jgi:hypothetical protein
MVRRRAKTDAEGTYLPRGSDQYAEEGGREAGINRRRFLQMGAGAAAGTLLLPVLPQTARADALVDGSIPLHFPLAYGTYKTPVQDFVNEFRISELAPLSGNRCTLGVGSPK